MSKIVSIHSFRGGTGKSNSTANLAAIVARFGHRVGIVDTDIQSPGIHVLFGFDEDKIKHSLNDYLWGRCLIEEAAYDVTSVLKKTGNKNSSIYLIPSSIKAGDITRVLREGFDFGLLNDGFQEVIDALDLDYLFIDTHPGLNEETLLSITISDILVLILRPDRQDFQGTAVTVEVARKLQVPKMLLMVNKALPILDFDALKQQVEKTYKAPVAGILPLSEEMIQMASSDLFCLRFPDHPLSKVMENVAKMIIA
ncbi:MinD/ParA family protein [Funiculus sociatus GB2-A5]|jgi:MinD-like ATPase involved in chromosome partitioning or flagellar assembly|uniref:MinD/ParA family protein n=1 Tax=Funiculus sociatus GB2-A5 TaxID=2933946 RepID=A0ABV0JT53_9CYAN|nr:MULTISPECIES: MinD/ParA family protein [unclassified Trichocoleus]MBD1904775.1 MinD/ParA family protein [Trichocoleus sp. FACHB-832]MBD2062898.1 MinD/ParA family protein [Trichocoleus sp. FACHB-6]